MKYTIYDENGRIMAQASSDKKARAILSAHPEYIAQSSSIIRVGYAARQNYRYAVASWSRYSEYYHPYY